MNHFCHLFLARPSVESRVGNLLGDFARGLDTRSLPEQVREGLEHHRAVDAFTDAHPEVLACKANFSHQRRRFSGIWISFSTTTCFVTGNGSATLINHNLSRCYIVILKQVMN